MREPQSLPLDPWEEAYARFETPEQEIRKFVRRLRQMGADRWPRDLTIVELFCGRGNGLHALQRLGFTRLTGADLSPALLARYDGSAECIVCDCRQLPFADGAKDIALVQGGLHHLAALPEDLEQTLREIQRVLKPTGRFCAVEPWMTPFLAAVHGGCNQPLARKLWTRVDALATMIAYERTTYLQWLSRPELILDLFLRYFKPEQCVRRLGKIVFVGTPRR